MDAIASYFKFSERKTELGIEARAGLTTFLVMAYIIFLNGNIIAGPLGLDKTAVAAGTVAVVGGASLAKWSEFSAGGSAVAESVGGRRIDRGIGTVGQKYGTGLGTKRQHVLRPVVLLVAPRPFVFPDEIAIVFVDGVTSRKPGLDMVAHLQPVEIDARFSLEHQRRRAERFEIGLCAGVDRV